MKMRTGLKFRGFCLIMLLLICSCTSAIKLNEFATSDLDARMASHRLPQYVVDKHKPKVAVLPPSDATQFKDSKLNLATNVQETLTQTIAQVGRVEVVERGQLKNFMDEMKFQSGITNEIDVNNFAKIAQGVDYVFVGSISSASVTAKFQAGSNYINKEGRRIYNSPTCSENATVVINYRLVTFPSGTVQQAFQMEGQKSGSPRNVTRDHECKVQSPEMLNEAINRAVDNSKESIAEAFPAFGYVYKTMTSKGNRKNRLAYINLGKSDGLVAGSKVEIIEFTEDKDPVKGTTMISPNVITECTVIENELQGDKSICVIAEDNAERVFSKAAVKTKVTTGGIRGMQKLYRKVF